ncbi:MAG: aminoacyl-tRNA hydrolase [Chloroflexota bacterium]
MRLVVGLGNPGRQYECSRHNIGFCCLDLLASRLGIRFGRRSFNAQLASGFIGEQRVLLAKPQTYMNLSGNAAGRLTAYYGLAATEMLVVYDDMDLPLGKLRIRARGSSGGHRGVQSIIGALGTNEFPRIRVGIGRSDRLDGADYVLGRFAAEDQPLLEDILGRAADAVAVVVSEGTAEAMNRYNA